MPNLTLDEAKAALHTVNYDLGDENPEVFYTNLYSYLHTYI